MLKSGEYRCIHDVHATETNGIALNPLRRSGRVALQRQRRHETVRRVHVHGALSGHERNGHHRRHCTRSTVCAQHGIQGKIGDDVPVDDDARAGRTMEPVPQLSGTARGPQQRCLQIGHNIELPGHAVGRPELRRPLLYLCGVRMRVDRDPCGSDSKDSFRGPRGDGTIKKVQQRLGNQLRERSQPSTQPGTEQQRKIRVTHAQSSRGVRSSGSNVRRSSARAAACGTRDSVSLT